MKYTPANGSIKVSITKQPPEHPVGILLTVTDTGMGIPKAQQEKIFTKMFRADNVKNAVDGTGFGLYLLKSVVELADGKVWFESEEGKGTTFFIELPFSGMRAKEGTSHLG